MLLSQDGTAKFGPTAPGDPATPQQALCPTDAVGDPVASPAAADASSYLSRLLKAEPALRAAVLSHDNTKLYTGVRLSIITAASSLRS